MTALPLIYGYCRIGEGLHANEDGVREEIRRFAASLGLPLRTVFVDRSFAPAHQRPALRTLLDVAAAFQPVTILVPSAEHLVQEPAERFWLHPQLSRCRCTLRAARGPASVASSHPLQSARSSAS